MSEHAFDENEFDVWGYDRGGHYNRTYDRKPFHASPYPTCPQCDNCEPCNAAKVAP